MFALSLVALAALLIQTPAIRPHTEAPPAELSDSIDAVLAAGGQRAIVDGKTLEFWWVKSLPLMPSSSGVAWEDVAEGTLVGAVSLPVAYTDNRDRPIAAGVYTLRFALLPLDGSHSGAARREVLLVCPADSDKSAASLGHDDAIDLAKETASAAPPAAWSLETTGADEQPLDVLKTDDDQTVIVFEVPVSREGTDVGRLRFSLVLVGTLRS